MRKSDTTIEPVTKRREVALEPEAAFELFTSRMGEWWPLLSHSVAAQQATGVRFEGHLGGRVVELVADGAEHVWAEVITWDPPHRLVLAWHPNPEAVAASIVEVRFEPTPDGSTLYLEHRGWEEFGAEAGEAGRAQYEPGWDGVLAEFVEASSD